MTTVQSHIAADGAPGSSGDAGARTGKGRGLDGLGARIRKARAARKVSVRELARLVDCSPSMISQIERGRAYPSVSTLYDISIALQISLDGLFSGGPGPRAHVKRASPDDPLGPPKVATSTPDEAPSGPGPPRAGDPIPQPDHRTAAIDGESLAILRKQSRRTIDLAHGVRWELLMPVPERSAEFMEVFYAPGGGSEGKGHAIRHNGREYCVIVEGLLSVQLGFEQCELEPGDSMAFDSTIPHRYWNAGTETVRAIWFVLDRWQVADPGWDPQPRSHP